MDSSGRQQASRLFKRWKQESAKVRVLFTEPPLNIIISGTLTDFDGDFLTVAGIDSIFAVDLDGAIFEEETMLPEFPVCVKVSISGDRRLIPESFGETRFLICELP